MLPADLPTVSAIVLAWKSEPWLRRCVTALLGSEKVAVEVVLVDNGCTDDDVEVLSELDGVTVVRPGENLGYSGGNNAGVKVSTGEYVALINGDAIVEPGTLARLVQELQDRPDVGIAAASVRLAEDPTLLNSRGNMVHVLGISWVGGLGEPETRTAPTDTAGAMGAGLVTTRAHWDRLGGFFEHYFAYHEDADLSIRTWRLGLRVVNVPDAVVVHRYEFARNNNKYYLVERNRLMFVLTLWSGRALALLAPALLALELAMVALAVKEGWLKDKARGWAWLWNHRKDLRARRSLARKAQTVPDSEWMKVLTSELNTPLINVPKVVLTPLNAVTTAYWKLIRRFV
ncbi:glycosyltransferase family 2 protein [Streptomyces sp. ID05-26A]|nr:glycosyltransferase family 2 protein [Streptomyces sp. ID05-26A]